MTKKVPQKREKKKGENLLLFSISEPFQAALAGGLKSELIGNVRDCLGRHRRSYSLLVYAMIESERRGCLFHRDIPTNKSFSVVVKTSARVPLKNCPYHSLSFCRPSRLFIALCPRGVLLLSR